MFQISALSPEPFAPLFALSDAELKARGARRVVADAMPGFPCRVSLADAEVGEELILLHFEHQPAETPFRAGHAIYVRRGVEPARPAPGEVPEALRRRPLSLRAFDAEGMMVDADVVDGAEAGPAIVRLLEDPRAAYVHLHYARPGCFAARADRLQASGDSSTSS